MDMRDSGHVGMNRYTLAVLLAILAIATLGCVPGGTGPFLTPPTAPVDHATVQPGHVRKMGGDIVLSYAPSGAELLTMGGSIAINRASGYVAIACESKAEWSTCPGDRSGPKRRSSGFARGSHPRAAETFARLAMTRPRRPD